MRKFFQFVCAGAATLSFASPVNAAVLFDPETGSGFVGKGDVQLAFGWNNKQTNNNFPSVTFSGRGQVIQSYTCEYDDWRGQTLIAENLTVVKEMPPQPINASLALDVRKNKIANVTGFNLNGYEDGLTVANAINVGEICNYQGDTGSVISVASPEIQGVNLFVNYNGTSVQLLYQ